MFIKYTGYSVFCGKTIPFKWQLQGDFVLYVFFVRFASSSSSFLYKELLSRE